MFRRSLSIGGFSGIISSDQRSQISLSLQPFSEHNDESSFLTTVEWVQQRHLCCSTSLLIRRWFHDFWQCGWFQRETTSLIKSVFLIFWSRNFITPVVPEATTSVPLISHRRLKGIFYRHGRASQAKPHLVQHSKGYCVDSAFADHWSLPRH